MLEPRDATATRPETTRIFTIPPSALRILRLGSLAYLRRPKSTSSSDGMDGSMDTYGVLTLGYILGLDLPSVNSHILCSVILWDLPT